MKRIEPNLLLAISTAFASDLVPWLLPVALPAIAAPLLIAATSYGTSNGRKPILFTTTSETAPAPIISEQQRIFLSWTQQRSALADPTIAGTATAHA